MGRSLLRRSAVGRVPLAYACDVSTRGRRERGLWAIVAVIGVVALAVRWLIPIDAIYVAGNDDALLVLQGYNLLQGDWLGGWLPLTLAKPPGYAFAIVAAWYLHLSPPVFSSAVYLIGVAATAVGLRRLRVPRWAVVALFAAGAANPALYGMGASRVYRDDLLAAQVALAVGFAMLLGTELRTRSSRAVSGIAIASAVILGLDLGWIYVTKKDVVVIAFVAGSIAFAACSLPARSRLRGWSRTAWRALAIVILTAVLPVAFVVGMNLRTYGYVGTEDFYSGAAARLWQSWARVEAGRPREWVPITRDQRLAVYEVSPAAARLRGYLEGRPNTGWRTQPCAVGVFCDESGPWFVWDLRDAFVQNGLAGSEQQYQESMSKVADEIEVACNDGRLSCSKWPAPVGLPRVDLINTDRVLDDARVAYNVSLGFVSADPSPGFNERGPLANQSMWRATVRGTDLESSPGGWDWRLRFGVEVGHRLRAVGQKVIEPCLIVVVLFLVAYLPFGRRRLRLALTSLGMLLGFGLSCLLLGFVAAGAYVGYAAAPGYSIPGSVLLVLGTGVGLCALGLVIADAARRMR